VANQVDAGMERVAENVAELSIRLAAPCLGQIPFAAAPDPLQAARLLDSARIASLASGAAQR
jgi:hypothetical protein